MKYRIQKGTATFDKLAAIYQLIRQANDASRRFAVEMGVDPWKGTLLMGRGLAAGGCGGLKFEEKPAGWKPVFDRKLKGFYFPTKIHANKEILRKIARLPVVTYAQINDAVGFREQFIDLPDEAVTMMVARSVGLHFREEFILIAVHDKAEFTPNADTEQIPNWVFEKLRGGEEEGGQEV